MSEGFSVNIDLGPYVGRRPHGNQNHSGLSKSRKVMLVVKNPPANAGDVRDSSSVPGSGRSSGGGHGNPLQYSCLGNLMIRGVWQAIDHRVAESDMTEVT